MTGSRVFVYHEFYSTWMLSVITPFVFFDDAPTLGKVANTVARMSMALTPFLLVVTTVISATRSVLIQAVVSLAFAVLGLARYRRLGVRWIMLAVVGFLLLISAAVVSSKAVEFDYNVVLDRVFTTQVEQEERVTELRMLLGEYGTDLLVGRGLGSQFASPVVSEGQDLAVAPHVAIFTLLMKGGIVAFAVGILLPLFWTIKTLILTKTARLYAACASVLMYFAFSSISGGWNFPTLFLYGFFLSYAFTLSQATAGIVRSSKHTSHHRTFVSPPNMYTNIPSQVNA